jgi:hypothetical protein
MCKNYVHGIERRAARPWSTVVLSGRSSQAGASWINQHVNWLQGKRSVQRNCKFFFVLLSLLNLDTYKQSNSKISFSKDSAEINQQVCTFL